MYPEMIDGSYFKPASAMLTAAGGENTLCSTGIHCGRLEEKPFVWNYIKFALAIAA
jgi:hypothetical protein